MNLSQRRVVKTTGAAIVVLLLTLIGSAAVTASNTVPDSQAGDGAGQITGYEVTNVSYTLNATNPQNIDGVTFDLDSTPAAGSDIQVRLDSIAGDWYTCTFAGTAVTCDTTTSTIAVASAGSPASKSSSTSNSARGPDSGSTAIVTGTWPVNPLPRTVTACVVSEPTGRKTSTGIVSFSVLYP